MIPPLTAHIFIAECLSVRLIIMYARQALVKSYCEVVLVCLSVTGLWLKYMGIHIVYVPFWHMPLRASPNILSSRLYINIHTCSADCCVAVYIMFAPPQNGTASYTYASDKVLWMITVNKSNRVILRKTSSLTCWNNRVSIPMKYRDKISLNPRTWHIILLFLPIILFPYARQSRLLCFWS